MELLLIRHAEPHRTEAAGDTPADPGLTELGHTQARALSRWLAHERIDVLVSSPSRRCRETAAPLVGRTGLPLRIVPGLREFNSEAPDYVPVQELFATGDERAAALARGEIYGTDPDEFRARVLAACEEIAAANPGNRVAAFAHGGTINVWAGHLIDSPKLIWATIDYASITRTAVNRSGLRSLVTLNETPHLHPAVTAATA